MSFQCVPDAIPDRNPDAAPVKAPASDRETGGRFTAAVVPDPEPPAVGACPGGAPTSSGPGRNVVFDSGLVALDDPRLVALHEGYDDLVKVFERRPSRL